MNENEYVAQMTPMDEIFSDDEFNCRGRIAPIDVIDLAKSIEEVGLQQPIIVQPYKHPKNEKIKYRIMAGHRRFVAFKINKRDKIPAFIREGLSDFDARLLNLTENLKRADLNMVQEARALLPFRDGNWSQEYIAARTGMSRGWVQVRLMLLDLPLDIQAQAAAGILTQEQVRQLYGMGSDEERYAAVRLIKERKEKGESADIAPKKPPKPGEKKERKIVEVIALQDYIQEQVGNSIVTRVLGWVGGFVTNYEMHRDLREFFKDRDKDYKIPKELIDQL